MIRFSVIATIAVCGVSSVHAQSAEEILSATGIQGGLVVHVDCGDGKLTAEQSVTTFCTFSYEFSFFGFDSWAAVVIIE